jgi:isopenicillin-N epimerase
MKVNVKVEERCVIGLRRSGPRGYIHPMHRFGAAMRAEWPLDPQVTYLNHGTVGVTPRRVLAEQQRIRDEIERQPSQFLLRELTAITVGPPGGGPPRMRCAAAAVAAVVGAEPDDLVFVDNATTGANAVLRSFPLGPGDEILVTDLTYGGVTRAAMFAARERGAEVRTAVMPYPVRSAGELVDACVAALGPRTRLMIIDHITSQSALILPLAEIAAECRARGVAVLADGAHAPGAIPLDIPSLGVDWYVANLHKWMWVPRSSGILWASAERQATLHPPVISWGLDQGFTTEFDLPGTRDPSAHLAAPAAIRMMEELGGPVVRKYTHALAWDGARLLAERWGTEFVTPESMIGTMATVPLPASMGSTADDATRVRHRLLVEEQIEVQVHAFRDRLHARISAEIYNQLDEIERLAVAVLR